MSSNEDTDTDPARQLHSTENPQSGQMEAMQTLVNSLLKLLGPQAPAVIPGALYRRDQIEANLGISENTTTLWMDNGLAKYKPATRADLFLGDDVIEFVKSHPELKRPENYKAKVEQRKKGRGK